MREGGDPGATQNAHCGTFFIFGCPFERDRFNQLEELATTPPATPPPPMPPLADLPMVPIRRALVGGIIAGGFDVKRCYDHVDGFNGTHSHGGTPLGPPCASRAPHDPFIAVELRTPRPHSPLLATGTAPHPRRVTNTSFVALYDVRIIDLNSRDLNQLSEELRIELFVSDDAAFFGTPCASFPASDYADRIRIESKARPNPPLSECPVATAGNANYCGYSDGQGGDFTLQGCAFHCRANGTTLFNYWTQYTDTIYGEVQRRSTEDIMQNLALYENLAPEDRCRCCSPDAATNANFAWSNDIKYDLYTNNGVCPASTSVPQPPPPAPPPVAPNTPAVTNGPIQLQCAAVDVRYVTVRVYGAGLELQLGEIKVFGEAIPFGAPPQMPPPSPLTPPPGHPPLEPSPPLTPPSSPLPPLEPSPPSTPTSDSSGDSSSGSSSASYGRRLFAEGSRRLQLLDTMVISPFARLTRMEYTHIVSSMDDVHRESHLKPCNQLEHLIDAVPAVCMRIGSRAECSRHYEVIPVEAVSEDDMPLTASSVRPCVWTGIRCRAHALVSHMCVVTSRGDNASSVNSPRDASDNSENSDSSDDLEIRDVWEDDNTTPDEDESPHDQVKDMDNETDVEVETELNELDEELIDESERPVRAMVHLTRFVCEHQHSLPKEAFQARIRAGTVWAHLDDAQSNRSCYDCVTRRLGSCELWFHTPRGTYEQQAQADSEIRNAQMELLQNAVGEHMDKACCARPRNQPWMPLQCNRKYCAIHAHRRGMQRIAHTLRTIATRSTHPVAQEMSVSDMMATDMLAPQQHSIEECRRDAFLHDGPRDGLSGPTDEECVLKSILHHTSQKHGVGVDQVHSALEAMGFSMVDMFRRAVQAAGGSAPASPRRQSIVPGRATVDASGAEMQNSARTAANQAQRRRTEEAHRRRAQATEDKARARLYETIPLTNNDDDDDNDDEFAFDPFAGMLRALAPRQDKEPVSRRAAAMFAATVEWRSRASDFVHNLSEANEWNSIRNGRGEGPHGTPSMANTFAYIVNGDGSAFRQLSDVAQGVAATINHVHNLTHTVRGAMDDRHTQERRRRALVERIERESPQGARLANSMQIKTFLNRFLEPPAQNTTRIATRRNMGVRKASSGASGGAAQQTVLEDLPDWYVRKYGKFVARVPWRDYFKRLDEFAKLEAKRMVWWRDRAHIDNEIPHELRHGHWALDQRLTPTGVGRLLRILAAYIAGDQAVWETEAGGSEAIDRNIRHVLESNPREAEHAPNWWGDPMHESVVTSVSNMLDAGGRSSSLRRLSEVASRSTLYAPYGLAYVIPPGITDSLSSISKWGLGTLTSVYTLAQSVLQVDETIKSIRGESEADVTIWDAVSRWFLYNVVLCYLYPRPSEPAESLGGTADEPAITDDGRSIRTFHSDHMCFPASTPLTPCLTRTIISQTLCSADRMCSSVSYVRSSLPSAEYAALSRVFQLYLRGRGRTQLHVRLQRKRGKSDNGGARQRRNHTDVSRMDASGIRVAPRRGGRRADGVRALGGCVQGVENGCGVSHRLRHHLQRRPLVHANPDPGPHDYLHVFAVRNNVFALLFNVDRVRLGAIICNSVAKIDRVKRVGADK